MPEAVVLEIVRSVQLTIPASSSNAIGPVLMESIEVMPEEESYSNAPPSMVRPELIVVVGLVFVWVLKVSNGTAVVEVANEKE